MINLNKVTGGFTLTNTDDFPADRLPHDIKLEIAYEVTKGNAFKKYSPHDFKLGNRDVIKCSGSSKSIKVLSSKHNVMEIQITDLPFQLSVTGFDSNRDLKIQVRQR